MSITTLGEIYVELFPKEAPKTVQNFVGLAEGTREFTDPKTGQKVKRPFYDGLTFHRVIARFMIQGGDPKGDGSGGPGGDRGRQSGLAMVNVSDGPDVDVRL